MKIPSKEIRPNNSKLNLGEGFKFIKRNTLLMRLIMINLFVTLVFSSTLSTQVFLVREVLHLSPIGFGLLVSVSTIGSLIASNLISVLSKKFQFKNLLIVSLFMMGVCFGAVGLTSNPLIVGILYGIGSFFIVIWNISNLSYRQRITPTELLGRVSGVVRFFSMGVTPIGMLFGGAIIIWLEPALTREWAIRTPNLILGITCIFLCLFVKYNESKDLTTT